MLVSLGKFKYLAVGHMWSEVCVRIKSNNLRKKDWINSFKAKCCLMLLVPYSLVFLCPGYGIMACCLISTNTLHELCVKEYLSMPIWYQANYDDLEQWWPVKCSEIHHWNLNEYGKVLTSEIIYGEMFLKREIVCPDFGGWRIINNFLTIWPFTYRQWNFPWKLDQCHFCWCPGSL